MFNFNAETFVILYPYAAGGRFLQMAMSLDPSTVAIHTGSYLQIKSEQLFYKYKKSLVAGHNNAHFNDSGHLPEYIPNNLPDAQRYVFCIHQIELAPALEFFRKCQNLKIFIINTSTEKSFQQLKARRWFFAQGVNLPLQDSYKLHASELQIIKSVNETLKFRIGTGPVDSIELEDYWEPSIAIPLLNKFFAEYNLNPSQWEELYYIWHDNAITSTLNELPSDC